MLLARGLRQQGQAICQNLKRELANRAKKIRALEQELEVAKKQAEEVETARKASEEQIKKMHEDFDEYRWQKRDERKKVIVDAQKVVDVYKDLIQSVGEETEAPSDAPVVDFMD